MPLAPSAALDSIGCGYALRTLFNNAGGKYDKSVFRIYKWHASDWMEYSSKKVRSFDFLPGDLFWLISRKEVLMDFGNGRSPSLKDTLDINLPSRAWTDFSSPYGFPVAFGDLIAATGLAALPLHFYQWSKDEPHRTWRADPLYSDSVPGLNAPETQLPFGTNGCFTHAPILP